MPAVKSAPPTKPSTSPGSHAIELSRSLYSGQVAATLREAIVGGQLRPGAPLVETRLAQELSLSRGPVRSALQALEGEGLVRTLENGRTIVVGFTQQDASDLFRVRYTLESTAIRWGIARHGNPEPMVQAVAALVASDASPTTVVDLDVQFHHALLEFSGSRHLMQSWLVIAPVIHAMITIGNRRLALRRHNFDLEQIIEAHRSLLSLILAREPQRATARLRQQFREVIPIYVQLNLDTTQ